MLHLLRGEFQAAQQGAGGLCFLFASAGRQKLHRGLFRWQQLAAVLGQVCRPDAGALLQRLPDAGQQRGLARSISAGQTDLPGPLHPQPDILRQQAAAVRGHEPGQLQFQHQLARRQGRHIPKKQLDGLLPLRHGGASSLLPFIPVLQRFYRPHLLFQQIAAVGVLPGDAAKLMLHLLLDTAQFFLLLGSGPLFTAGNPSLTLLLRFPPGTVIPISHSKGGGLAAGLAAQLLQMDDLVCHPFQQCLVMGDEQQGPLPPAQKFF